MSYSWKSYFIVQADYQHWANEALFAALDHLNPDVLQTDQGLALNSIHHTLDHLLTVSRMGRARLRGEALELDAKVIHYPDWRELRSLLRRETRKLQSWLEAQPDETFEAKVQVLEGDGPRRSMWVRDVLVHVLTHFAHDRGQICAVATRLGAPCPDLAFETYKRRIDQLMHNVQRESPGLLGVTPGSGAVQAGG